jgi:FAD/FMN-containing dehydrogenase
LTVPPPAAPTILRPADAEYERARRVYNGLIDRRPELIARCERVEDIAAAVEIARGRDLEISVRGGGHGVAGHAVTEGGVMIDLSLMKAIEVDPAGRRARAEPGVTWNELNAATQAHGLAVTGGVISSTGIAGLTLGGGIGSLMGAFGLAADNLVAAQTVTASGDVVAASELANPDLFWGLRGGGGNLGIVSSFEFRLHEVGPVVIGGLVWHPFSVARELVRAFRAWTADSPDELALAVALLHAPDGSSTRLAALIVCHVGDHPSAERDVERIAAFGSPVRSHLGPIRYRVVNSMLDRVYPWGSLNYWKSAFLDDLSDDAVEVITEQFNHCPSTMTSVLIERFGGAVTRVPVEATAFPHREPGFNLLITSVWTDPARTEENINWTKSTFEAMRPFMAQGRYANYLAHDDTGDAVARAAYGPNYERLRRVKAIYDPANVFHLNVNVPPSHVD